MIDNILQLPIFGVCLTLVCFSLGQKIYKKTGHTLLQPIISSTILIIIILKIIDMDYEIYKGQNEILNFMLAPTAVVLAVPLYKNSHILKKNWGPLLLGIVIGSLTTIGTGILMCKLLGTDISILLSMIPKGVTTPIAMGVSNAIGGIPSLTLALVVYTGILGGAIGPEILRMMGIKDKRAQGIALGSMCHAVGTARAFQEGELEGSMASLAMCITGIIVAIIAPFIAFLV